MRVTYIPDGLVARTAEHKFTISEHNRIDCTGTKRQRESVAESENDRVVVLGPGANRFVPQWAGEIRDPRDVVGFRMNYAIPLEPELFDCPKCETTWLGGDAGHAAVACHPSHDTLYHPEEGTSRSLVVHTDGACTGNGRAAARAGIGVYFGAGSKYNASVPLETFSVPTNQVAELCALLQAMEIVREEILPARSILVQGNDDLKCFQLVLVTDSSYAVECMCKHWATWTVDAERKVLKNREGRHIANSAILLDVQAVLERLSQAGVQVMYHHVRRELNKAADALAKAGAARWIK